MGLNHDVAPAGRVEVDSVTGFSKLPVDVTIMVSDEVLPCTTVSDDVTGLSEKSALGLTVRDTVTVCCKDPLVPVTVRVNVPAVAVELTSKVMVVVIGPFAGGVTGFAEKLAATPLGSPETVRLTGWLKSPTEVTVIVTGEELPLLMLREVGMAPRLKSGGTLTVRETVAECVRLPLVPVIVTVKVPVVAVDVAVRVMMEETAPLGGGVTGLMLKLAVTPVGRPVTVRVVGLLNPPIEETVAVVVAVWPRMSVMVVGDADTLRPGGT